MSPTTSMNSNTHTKKYHNTHDTNGNAQDMEQTKMGKRGKLIIYFTRTEKKNNPKSGGKFLYYGR